MAPGRTHHDWNFGMPRKGQVVHHMRDVQIMRGGQRYTASYHLEAGRLVVSSAWGSRSAKAGRDLAANDRAATRLLEAIVAERRSGAP